MSEVLEIGKENNPENGKEWKEMSDEVLSQADNGEHRETTGEAEVRLLNPETDDLGRAASLLFQVDPFICPDFFGDKERAAKMGEALFSEEGGLFDPGHTLIAEQDGEMLGILVYADNQIKPWDTVGVKAKIEALGIEMPEHFDRANEQYMKPVVDDARGLPDGVAEVELCATDEAARGKGIGTKMFEEFLSQKQYHEQHLTVLADNPAAIHLYEKMGFKIVSTQTGYPDDSVVTHNMIRKPEEA